MNIATAFIFSGLFLFCLPHIARDLRFFMRWRQIRKVRSLRSEVIAHNNRVWERRQAKQIAREATKRALRGLRKKGVLLVALTPLLVGCEVRRDKSPGGKPDGCIYGPSASYVGEWFDYEGHRYIRAVGGGLIHAASCTNHNAPKVESVSIGGLMPNGFTIQSDRDNLKTQLEEGVRLLESLRLQSH